MEMEVLRCVNSFRKQTQRNSRGKTEGRLECCQRNFTMVGEVLSPIKPVSFAPAVPWLHVYREILYAIPFQLAGTAYPWRASG